MSRKNTRTCLICGKEYEYCASCRGIQAADYWKLAWCSENCKAISSILANVEAHQLSTNDARTQLGKCDLTKIATFVAKPKTNINNILNGTAKNADKTTADKTTDKVETK